MLVPDVGSFTVSCGADGVPSELVPPTGEPSTGFEVDRAAYHYLRGDSTWQAQCETAAAGTSPGTVAWGDNLTGSAQKDPGKPIRAEVALNDDAATAMGGYTVVKLEPSSADNVSAYGTEATQESGSYVANPLTPFGSTGVYDAGTTLIIYNKSTGVSVVSGPASAETNATGAAVYGYNLNVATAGYYVIERTAPNVILTGADAGTVSDNTASLEITVGTPPTEPTTPTTPTTPTLPTPPTPPTLPTTPTSPTSPATPGGGGTANGSGGTGSVGSGGTGSAPATHRIAVALAVKQRAVVQLDKAIGTINASIHKYHAASIRALRQHLAIPQKLAANVRRLEIQLHSLLRRRQALVASMAQLRARLS